MLAAVSAPANAQAVLVASVPAPGTKVSVGDFAFHLRFNGLIDHEQSRLTLMHPDGSAEHLVIAEVGPPQVVSSIARLTEGAYVLHWEAMQVGGHITSGSLSFTAGAQ
jgi:methionine-rich copper-binding protein CopC